MIVPTSLRLEKQNRLGRDLVHLEAAEFDVVGVAARIGAAVVGRFVNTGVADELLQVITPGGGVGKFVVVLIGIHSGGQAELLQIGDAGDRLRAGRGFG